MPNGGVAASPRIAALQDACDPSGPSPMSVAELACLAILQEPQKAAVSELARRLASCKAQLSLFLSAQV